MRNTGPRPLLDAADERPRYVRFSRITDRGFVEFSFGVGSPDLMTELVLPLDDYRQFCDINRVVHLTPAQEQALDIEQSKWRFGQPGVTE